MPETSVSLFESRHSSFSALRPPRGTVLLIRLLPACITSSEVNAMSGRRSLMRLPLIFSSRRLF